VLNAERINMDWTTILPYTFWGKSLTVFLISMLPIVELRGAIPTGVALGLDFRYCFVLAVVGNLTPIPFILLFIKRIFAWLRKKSRLLVRLVQKLETRALNKQDAVRRLEFWGLLVFVAIPLPGTGAWSGALIAALMNMRLKYAFPAIAGGVIIAGIIIMILSYGVAAIFR
jgi:uncharacterized membrane protein